MFPICVSLSHDKQNQIKQNGTMLIRSKIFGFDCGCCRCCYASLGNVLFFFSHVLSMPRHFYMFCRRCEPKRDSHARAHSFCSDVLIGIACGFIVEGSVTLNRREVQMINGIQCCRVMFIVSSREKKYYQHTTYTQILNDREDSMQSEFDVWPCQKIEFEEDTICAKRQMWII